MDTDERGIEHRRARDTPNPPPGRRRRKVRPAPAPARQWDLRYALTAYLITLVIGFALAIALSLGELRAGMGVLAIDLVMLAALVPLYRRRRFAPADLGLRPTSAPPAVGLVFCAWLAYLIVVLIWVRVVLGHSANPHPPQLHDGLLAKVIVGFAAALCAPVVEEIFFRGLLYRALRNRLAVLPAVLIAGVLFAAVHASTYPLDTLPPKIVFGAIACLLYERTGSLYPGIALHCLIDGSGFESAISHGDVGVAYGTAVLVAVVCLVVHRFRPATKRELAAFQWRPGRGSDREEEARGSRVN